MYYYISASTFAVALLVQFARTSTHYAHDKINLDVEQDAGANSLLRETDGKHLDGAVEIEAADEDAGRLNRSAHPQALLSDEHSSQYRRQKREAKVKRELLMGPGANGPKVRERSHHYQYPPLVKEVDKTTLPPQGPKKSVILPEHMSPGVIFRVRMSDAILRIKQRMYEEPGKHMRADIMYTTLIRKVVTDEITKFHNLLLMYRTDRTIKEHVGECGGRIYKFISFMTIKVHIYCLFDALWIDGMPYIIGDEYSVTPSDAPPMLQCDAAECNSVNFVDSLSETKEPDE